MKAMKRSIIAITAAAILLILLFPPFMCVDAESGGRVHATLGYYPVWNPPSPEVAFRVLYPESREIPSPERLAAVIPRVNRVRLKVTAYAVALAGCLIILALRK
jgi:hypothetical protein